MKEKKFLLWVETPHPFSTIDRTNREKISKDIEELNSTINQPDLIVTYRTLHSATAFTFFQELTDLL